MIPALQSRLPLADSFRPEYLRYYQILPLEIVDGRLQVAVTGEPNQDVLDDLRQAYDCELVLTPADSTDLEEGIRLTFASAESVIDLIRGLGAAPDQVNRDLGHSVADTRNLANQPPVIRFVNLLIREAYDAGASDIHLEATAAGLQIRVRIDGVLSDAPNPPPSLQEAVISRLKLLAELDIAERRIPQDGRIRVRMETRELDLRVATVPTLYGESVVLRLLDRGGRPVALSELGMDEQTFKSVEGLAQQSHGIILSTGPTGSGKTTTLYSALTLRQATREKIITVEDPIEYHLSGVTQVPVHTKVGMTFATALRSILRQDPDVLMVGEMRDAETAGIAIQAALTGHLVFSTLHTNDAVSAIVRLTDLGVEPYLIAATLEGVLAQRLVRRICAECRTSYRPDAATAALMAHHTVDAAELQRGTGCSACRHTGYRGRVGLFELFRMSDEIRDRIAHGAGTATLRQGGIENGMRVLWTDGWQKVRAGLTTAEELLRVLGS